MKQEPQVVFEELFARIAEGLRKEFEEARSMATRAFIEKVDVDLWAILEAAQVMKDLCDEKEASYDNFQGWFFSQWKFGCSEKFVNFFEKQIRQGDVSAVYLFEEICAYGTKLKAVVGGLCVSPTIEVDCEVCYFSSVCKQKKE